MGAYAGRMILPSDDVPGAAPVAVLSYAAWQAAHGGDRNVVGSTFLHPESPRDCCRHRSSWILRRPHHSNPPAIWIPLNAEPVLEGETSILKQPASNWLYVLGRLKPEVAPAALQSKISNTLRHWLATQPAYTLNGADREIPKQHVVMAPGGAGIQNLQQQTGDGLRLLTGISALVLLVACANVANLLLARGTARRAETSIRTALGAARSVLMRQLLVESVLLAAAGGVIGIAIAYAGAKMILGLAFPDSTQIPIHASPSPSFSDSPSCSRCDWNHLWIVPAWVSSHSDPAEALRGVNRSTGDRALLPQKTLIVLQAALSLVLLVGAGLMTQTLRNLERQNFGITTANRYVIHIDPMGAGYNMDTVRTFNEQLEREFTALPGAKSVGIALYSTLEGNNWGEGV